MGIEEIGGRLTLSHCRSQHDRRQRRCYERRYEARYRISSRCSVARFSGTHAFHIPTRDRDCLRPARASPNCHKTTVISRGQQRCDSITRPVETAIVLPRAGHWSATVDRPVSSWSIKIPTAKLQSPTHSQNAKPPSPSCQLEFGEVGSALGFGAWNLGFDALLMTRTVLLSAGGWRNSLDVKRGGGGGRGPMNHLWIDPGIGLNHGHPAYDARPGIEGLPL